jgi:hypothetical protein
VANPLPSSSLSPLSFPLRVCFFFLLFHFTDKSEFQYEDDVDTPGWPAPWKKGGVLCKRDGGTPSKG